MARGGVTDLSPVCAFVAERTGTSLSQHQVLRLKEVLSSRLEGRSEQEFLAHLKTSRGLRDLADLMAAISVHKTDLFRDEGQLEAFRRHVLGPLAAQAARPLRLWSAGCATGEEVATLLILLAEAGAHPESTVLGTDLSARALEAAVKLSFQPEGMRRVPAPLRGKYFRERSGRFELLDELRARARFQQHNLMDFPYPAAKGAPGFDVIFCRNVLIYFTEEAFDQVVRGLRDRLHPEGTLVLSAAEPILRAPEGVVTIQAEGAFFYRLQRAAPESAPPLGIGPVRATGEYLTPSSQPWRLDSAGRERSPVRPSPSTGLGAGYVEAMADPAEAQAAEPVQPWPDPAKEALARFQRLLEAASAGEDDQKTEQALRHCLYLSPHLAQARYLLGMILEQRGARADAASEYRRALATLAEGKAPEFPFFLNPARLRIACKLALERVGYVR